MPFSFWDLPKLQAKSKGRDKNEKPEMLAFRLLVQNTERKVSTSYVGGKKY